MDFRDTHFHFSGTRDPEVTAKEALAAGVSGILACSSTFEEAFRYRDLAEKIPSVFFAAGVHPHEADSSAGEFSVFREFVKSPKLRAVGEIGLDFFYDLSGREKQISVFEKMLELALEHRLPASIHCRDAEGESGAYRLALPILRDFSAAGGTFVLHCFAGSMEMMERFGELGSYFGVGGMLTFRRAENIRELAKHYPEDKILLETDSPYLAPVPHRGEENLPAYIPLIADTLAAVRGVSTERTAEFTTANAKRLFGNF